MKIISSKKQSKNLLKHLETAKYCDHTNDKNKQFQKAPKYTDPKYKFANFAHKQATNLR